MQTEPVTPRIEEIDLEAFALLSEITPPSRRLRIARFELLVHGSRVVVRSADAECLIIH